MKFRLSLPVASFLVVTSLSLTGCDMGTYQERLEQRIDDLRENDLPENRAGDVDDANESFEQ